MTTTKLEELRVKRDAVHAEGKRIKEQMQAKLRNVQKRLDKLNADILREEVSAWLGQSVRYRFTLPHSDPQAWMNDAIGTLVEVRRTRCTVDFGDRGRWNLPLDEIKHGDDLVERGMVLTW